MRRVVFVVENESVPTDRRVWREATTMAEAGFDVTVLGPVGEGRDLEREIVLDGVRVVRFPLDRADGTVRGYVREYVSAAVRVAGGLWAEGDVDVVHVANPPDFLLIAALPLKLRHRTKLVFDHHDLFPELFESRFQRRGLGHLVARALERITFALADVVVSTNESYRRLAIERGGIEPDHAFVVRNAPDPAVFSPGAPDPALRRGRALLGVYVGVIGPQDGADVALRALAIYKHDLGRDDLHVAFVGDGEALDGCHRLAAELNIEDMVEFTGWLETDDVVGYLSTADIALAPDPPSPLNDRSTMIKVIEYLTMGVPTVSFDLPESVVTAGGHALMVAGGDVEGFARAMATLADDPDRRRELGSGGREWARENLSWTTSQQRLRDAYRQLLDGPLPSGD